MQISNKELPAFDWAKKARKGKRYVVITFNRYDDGRGIWSVFQSGQRSWEAVLISGSSPKNPDNIVHGNAGNVFLNLTDSAQNIYQVFETNGEQEFRVAMIEALAFGTVREHDFEVLMLNVGKED